MIADARPMQEVRAPRRLLVLAVTVTLLWAGGCANRDPVTAARENGRSGNHTQAIDTLLQAAVDGDRSASVQAELLRQQELQASRRLQSFAEALRNNRLEAARQELTQLVLEQPNNSRLPAMREQLATAQRDALDFDRASSAIAQGRYDEARTQLRRVLARDPANPTARRMIVDLPAGGTADQVAAALPLPEALRRPVTVEFRDATLRNVFETLTRMAQVNFVFDKDVRGETKVTLFLRNVSLDEAVRTIMQSQNLDMRLLNGSTFLVFPRSAAKARDYVPLEARAFWLSNIDVKQASAMLRSVVKSKDIFVDERLNMMVVKDTPAAVQLASQLLQSIDVADSEVIIEIEVLEIASTKLQELGIRYPNSISYGLVQLPNAGNAAGSIAGAIGNAASNISSVITRDNWTALTAQVANPLLIANLRATDGTVNLLSNPRIRVRNREKAKFQVGEKVPVFTTQFAASALGASNAIGASTTYIDVGLKVEVEPQIYYENEVAMKVALEVSNILEQVQGPAQTTAYRIGTRQAQTVLRLRDSETQVLAGLISDSDRRNAQRIPGLGKLPVLGRLFSNESKQAERSEIVLMITPRIVRTIDRWAGSPGSMPAGTEAVTGAPPLTLPSGARASLAPARGGGAAGPATSNAANPTPAPAGSERQAPTAMPTSSGELKLSAPDQVKAGQDLTISLTLEGIELNGAVEVELNYDSSAFSPATATSMPGSNQASVTLSGSGPTRSGQLKLRASPGGARSGTIGVAEIRARGPDGAAVSGISLPAPVTVGISP
jgi:general secretion pathway protein D